MKNKPLFAIILVVFIDLLGFSLILPLLPYYAETFNASEFVVGLLVASYAAAQLIGAPLLGRLSDRYGRRPVLLASIFGTFASFLLLGFARSLAILFLARVLDGLTGGNISVAQAYIADVTDAKSRARGLGLIGAAFGLGFIIGPVVGGSLSVFGYAVPAFAAGALAFVNLVLVALWLPESLTAEKRAAMPERQPRVTLGALFGALRREFVGPLLISRFFFALAFAVLQTIFALYALNRFGLQAAQTGYILAYVGVLSVITQGFLVGLLTKRVREDRLIFFALAVMTIGLAGWALTPSVPWLLVALLPIAMAGGLLNTILSSTLTKAVEPQEIGGILGLSASMESLTRVISPTLGGLLLGSVGAWAPGAFSAGLTLLVLVYVGFAVLGHPAAEKLSEAQTGAPVPAGH